MLHTVTHIGAYRLGEKQPGAADGGSCSIDPRQLTGFLKVATYGRPSALTDVCGQGHGCNRHSEILRVPNGTRHRLLRDDVTEPLVGGHWSAQSCELSDASLSGNEN